MLGKLVRAVNKAPWFHGGFASLSQVMAPECRLINYGGSAMSLMFFLTVIREYIILFSLEEFGWKKANQALNISGKNSAG